MDAEGNPAINVTGFYWLMWIALALAGVGCRLGQQVTHTGG
jgi:hypothetical protein